MGLQVGVDGFSTLRVYNIKNKKVRHDGMVALDCIQGETSHE